MYPFERFSDEAKTVLVLAQREAERAQHHYVGTEHVLLALFQSDTEAARILARLGVEEESVRQTIERVVGRNERIVIQQIIPTQRVKKVIDIAVDLSAREGTGMVTPVHLLVGLLEEGEGIAVHVLEDLGVSPDAVGAARSAPEEG